MKTTSPFPPVKEQFCLNCMYLRDGRCRRNPPVLLPKSSAYMPPCGGLWPTVEASDWCGEWIAVEEGL